MLTIDGSLGEGGGQVLRTCLSLSALTGKPFQITRIRANRSRPGLKPQHLTAVRAVAALCDAEVRGDDLDAQALTFVPGSGPMAGEYTYDVTEHSPSGRSAGSVTLIVQAILWPLLFAGGTSRVILKGGTFVPFSPPFSYLEHVALPAFQRFGLEASVVLRRWGWMEAGGGEIELVVEPSKSLQGVDFEPVPQKRVEGVAAVTNLPSHIPHRMARRAHNLLAEHGFEPSVQAVRERGAGPGAGIVLWLAQGGFSAPGRKGLPADKVAESAVYPLLSFVDSGAAVDFHLADQLLVPMALAHGRSSFTTDRLTAHTLTNIDLLCQWLAVTIDITGEQDKAGRVVVTGSGI